ncbi:hypothetical protein KIL84_000140 [Mauremys mutica]|uniref:Uncharacterized protein n=1 Tax=Mauremys mutica TaxID=74926 RepID=A0A9D3XBV5_9SAUR|nr:hypothetical protein KIL84_000140 [Mauremys mutica]
MSPSPRAGRGCAPSLPPPPPGRAEEPRYKGWHKAGGSQCAEEAAQPRLPGRTRPLLARWRGEPRAGGHGDAEPLEAAAPAAQHAAGQGLPMRRDHRGAERAVPGAQEHPGGQQRLPEVAGGARQPAQPGPRDGEPGRLPPGAGLHLHRPPGRVRAGGAGPGRGAGGRQLPAGAGPGGPVQEEAEADGQVLPPARRLQPLRQDGQGAAGRHPRHPDLLLGCPPACGHAAWRAPQPPQHPVRGALRLRLPGHRPAPAWAVPTREALLPPLRPGPLQKEPPQPFLPAAAHRQTPPGGQQGALAAPRARQPPGQRFPAGQPQLRLQRPPPGGRRRDPPCGALPWQPALCRAPGPGRRPRLPVPLDEARAPGQLPGGV